MGTRGLRIVRYRGRFYVYYNQYDSYPEGWPTGLVKEIPKTAEAFKVWLAAQRTQYESYHKALEGYLDVVYAGPGAGIEESVHQISCSSTPPSPTKSEWAGCPQTYGLPHFTTQFNDLYIEYIYIIDLDHEIFSVNNKVHFKLSQIPRTDWISALSRNDGEYTLDLIKTPKSAVGMVARPLKPITSEMKDAYSELNVKKVSARGLRGFPPTQRHGPLLCLALFQRFREEESVMLEHLLGSWSTQDFAFREYAHLILCFASMSRNLTLEVGDRLHYKNREGYANLYNEDEHTDISEFLTIPGIGCHLKGQESDIWKDSSTYWFEGALIRLVPELEDQDHDDAVKEQTTLLHQYCTTAYPNKCIDAVLLSVASVVLCKIHADGSMEHTECLTLFNLSNDYTVNQGADRAGYSDAEEDFDQHQLKQPADVEGEKDASDQEEAPKSIGAEVEMMGLFNQLIFGADPDLNSIAAGFRGLQEESKSSKDQKNDIDPNEKLRSAKELAAEKGKNKVETSGAYQQEQSTEHSGESNHDEGDDQKSPSQSKQQQQDSTEDSDGSEDNDRDLPSETGPGATSMTMIPTNDGYMIERFNADGTTASTEQYRETVRGGIHVTERVPTDPSKDTGASIDAAFLALSQFFNATAREAVKSYRPTQHGALPLEAYHLIINEVEDMETYRACMVVSRVFRDICVENFRLDDEDIFIASEGTKGDTDNAIKLVAQGVMEYNIVGRSAGERVRVRLDKPKRASFSEVIEDSRAVYTAVAGNQRNQRILVPSTASVFA